MSVYSPYTKKYQNPNPVSEKTISISSAKEEEKKIAAMGLGELKDFACPKALQHKKDWYMTCVSCDGVDSCKAGRRVLEILENDTKPEEKVSQIDKFNAKFSNVEKPVVKGVNEKYALLGKEGYIKALQQPDPVAYLMKMNGTSLNGAKQRLYKWKQKYPDVAEYFYKLGNDNKNTHKITSPADGRNANNARIAEEARQRVIAAFTYPDGVYAYYENVRGHKVSRLSRTNVRNHIRELAKKYPDLDKKYHMSEWMEANRVRSGRKESGSLPEENMVHLRLNKVSEPESDEVSVDDFLAEMDGKKAEDYGKKLDPDVEVPEEKPTIVEKPFDTIKAEIEIQEKAEKVKAEAEKDRNKQNRLAACLVFSEKRIEIVKAINERRIMIGKLQEEMNDFDDKLKKLDAAAEIMGFVVDGGT